jgi:hypothetical protein
MNYVLLPLCALPWRALNFANKHTYLGMILLTVVFGLPTAFGARRYYNQ